MYGLARRLPRQTVVDAWMGEGFVGRNNSREIRYGGWFG